jgi:translation initiation factor IF-2
MTHKKKSARQTAAPTGEVERTRAGEERTAASPVRLEVVLKSDTVGTLDAAARSLEEIRGEGAEVSVIHQGVGAVSKSDLLMALTGSRLVVGFAVDVVPTAEEFAVEKRAEIRLYRVIYDLVEDVRRIARSWGPVKSEERITGQAKVVALFKSSRRGIILGCEVQRGSLALGKRFRVITAMGPTYEGTVESLHIEANPVKEARPGQRVGLKIEGFKDAAVGDLVECFEVVSTGGKDPWSPRGGIRVARD